MISRLVHDSITWVDLEAPTPEEVAEIGREFKLDLFITQELTIPSMKPRVEIRPEFLYASLHFPAFRHTHGSSPSQEVDFVVGKRFIITTHYETIDPIFDFAKAFEVAALVGKKGSALHGGHLFFEMVRRLYGGTHDELEDINVNLTRIEKEIFAGNEQQMVASISEESRKLLNIKRILTPHRDILESFELASEKLFGEDFPLYVKAMLAEYFRVFERTQAYFDSVVELRETNNSLLTTKQNEIMKILTIMAFVTFPLSLIADIFNLETSFVPIVGMPNDFWIIIGIMLTLSLLFFAFFKRKKWL
jgi:magnesium transporter